MNHVDAGHQLKQFARHVARRPIAVRAIADLSGVSLGMGDELANRRGRERRIDLHDVRYAANTRDRRDVTDEIEVEVWVERRVNCVRRGSQKKRMAVRSGADDGFGGEVGGA